MPAPIRKVLSLSLRMPHTHSLAYRGALFALVMAFSLSPLFALAQTSPKADSSNLFDPSHLMEGSTQGTAVPTAKDSKETAPSLTAPKAAPVDMVSPNTTSSDGVRLPAPPPAGVLSNDPNQLALQAEQAALQAQAELDAAAAKRDLEHNRKSYNRASMGLLPLSPDQVRGFMHRLQQTQEAAMPPYEGQPKGKVRIVNVSLEPGAEPPTVHLAAGYVTTINILDATGEPWPILDVGVGGNFDISPTKADTHIVRIMPLTRYTAGNLSVLMKDLATPVIFRLVADSTSDVDLRLDVRVPKFGPSAKIPIVDRSRLEAGDETIMAFLQNLPPKDAKRLKLAGLDARTMAWSLGEHVYVRTPLTLLSPAWNASVNAADGMAVYEIGDAPVLLMSDNGAVMRARVLRGDDHDK